MAISVDPEWWKTLFDEVYLRTDARSVCDGELTSLEVDAVCDLLPLADGDRILDLCGGQGRHSLELGARGFRGCTVLDFSGPLVELGRQAAARRELPVEFIQGDAVGTGLPGGSFNHVLIMGNSLGYLPGKDGDRRILAEASRLLRPGGWILVDVTDGDKVRNGFSPNAWHEIGEELIVCRERELEKDRLRVREVVLDKRKGLVRDRTYAVRLYLPDEIAALVEEAGFDDVTARPGGAVACGGDRGFMNHRVLIRGRKAEA